MNLNSLYKTSWDFIDDWLGFVIAFGNFEGTYYRYIKRHVGRGTPPSELLWRE